MKPVESEKDEDIMKEINDEFGCKCGTPNCPGHEVVDGHVVIQNPPAPKGA